MRLLVSRPHQLQPVSMAARSGALPGNRCFVLEVVVLGRDGLLDHTARQAEITTLLALLAELGDAAPPDARSDLRRLQQHITQVLPALLMFAAALDDVQQEM